MENSRIEDLKNFADDFNDRLISSEKEIFQKKMNPHVHEPRKRNNSTSPNLVQKANSMVN